MYKAIASGTFAIWRYDQFPYLLGAEITHMNEQGDIWAKGYGSGYGFRPVKILPTEAGNAFMAKINALTDERDVALSALNANFKAKLDTILSSENIKGT